MPIHPKIIVKESFTLDYRRIIAWVTGRNEKAGAQFSEQTKESLIIAWLIKLQRSFPFNIFLAEGSFFYILISYRKAVNIIRQQDVNVVFSSFMPYADHIIAWMLKRKFPHLIWIADYRDLHVEPIYKNVLWPDFQKKVEKIILNKADVVTTVSDGLSQKMSALHHHVHTITKGVDLRETTEHFEKFTIFYSGSLFKDFRDPKPLSNALSQLIHQQKIDIDKISFIYAGKDGALMSKWASECNISDLFENKGLLTRDEAIHLQDKAHINLLLTSASKEHTGLLTGKLFEYIESGREILCLINGTQDKEIESIFQNYGLGKVLYDQDSVKDYILVKYNEWMETGQVKSNQNKNEIVQDISWERQAEKIINLVKAALAKKKGTDVDYLGN
jgi:glycosyltransferase involved in cell wall biosynthesis